MRFLRSNSSYVGTCTLVHDVCVAFVCGQARSMRCLYRRRPAGSTVIKSPLTRSNALPLSTMVRQPRVEILAATNALATSTLNGRLFFSDVSTPVFKVVAIAINKAATSIAAATLDKELFVLEYRDDRLSFHEVARQ